MGVIEKAKIACEGSLYKVTDHFGGADKMVELGSGSKRKVSDYKLSRYACYLITQNAGYRGLYNGETADDIAKRQRLRC